MSQSSQITLEQLKQQSTETLKHYVLENKWIPLKHRTRQPDGKGLSDKQAEFLCLTCREALYGGAAGGGKSDALLMAALMFVDVPRYNAILFRRTYQDLALPEALINRSLQWLGQTGAKWNGVDHVWIFPSGARLQFGYMATELDKFRYQSTEFQFIGFDELTQFVESQYRFMFSRLRRLADIPIPLRMRAASNPGGIGHDWVKRRFVDPPSRERPFIPAKLQDNPNLDRDTYVETLSELDPITRQQYLQGDWTARHGGSKFKREWFKIVDAGPVEARRIRYWDMAATTPELGKDPDWTVGAKVAEAEGIYYIEDVKRTRSSPRDVEALILQTAILDGARVDIHMEEEPGSAGLSLVSHYSRNVLKGYTFYGDKVTGPKEVRANPFSSAAEAGNVKLVNGKWINDFLDEAEAFPLGEHDDQVDAVGGAFEKLREQFKPSAAYVEW